MTELPFEQEPAASLVGTEQPFGREHAAISGSESSRAASIIISEPYRLNQLTYTLALIKEVLRIFPAVSGTRAGGPGLVRNGRGWPSVPHKQFPHLG